MNIMTDSSLKVIIINFFIDIIDQNTTILLLSHKNAASFIKPFQV